MRSYRSIALAICICIQLTVATREQPRPGVDRPDTLENWASVGDMSVLHVGDILVSLNAEYHGILQVNGQFQVFTKTGQMISKLGASSNSYSLTGYDLIMQPDGNLVIYNDETGQPVWHSSTYTPNSEGGQYYLRLENNGVLMIRGPGNKVLWTLKPADSQVGEDEENPSPNPNPNPNPGCPSPRPVFDRPDTLQNWASVGNNSVLHLGDSLVSLNGEYRGTLQSNGQFQIFNKAGQMIGKVGAITDSYSASGFDMIMQPDGNLVIYNSDSHNPIYASGTYVGECLGGLYFARLTNDGSLVIYDESEQVKFRS